MDSSSSNNTSPTPSPKPPVEKESMDGFKPMHEAPTDGTEVWLQIPEQPLVRAYFDRMHDSWATADGKYWTPLPQLRWKPIKSDSIQSPPPVQGLVEALERVAAYDTNASLGNCYGSIQKIHVIAKQALHTYRTSQQCKGYNIEMIEKMAKLARQLGNCRPSERQEILDAMDKLRDAYRTSQQQEGK